MSRWLLEIPRTSRSCSVNSTRGFTCEAICWISRMSASYTAQHSHCNNTYTATTYCTSRQLLRWVQLSTIPSVCYSVWNREILRCWLDALQQHSDCSNIYTATTLTLQQHLHCNNTYTAATLTLQRHIVRVHNSFVGLRCPHLLLQHTVLQCINIMCCSVHTSFCNTMCCSVSTMCCTRLHPTHTLQQHMHCHNAYTATNCRVSLMASFHRKNGHQAHFSDFFNLEAIWNSDYRAVRVAPTEGERKRFRQKRRERKKERQMWKGRERDGNFHYLSQERETYTGSKDI